MAYPGVHDPYDLAVESVVGETCTLDESLAEEERELVIAVARQAWTFSVPSRRAYRPLAFAHPSTLRSLARLAVLSQSGHGRSRERQRAVRFHEIPPSTQVWRDQPHPEMSERPGCGRLHPEVTGSLQNQRIYASQVFRAPRRSPAVRISPARCSPLHHVRRTSFDPPRHPSPLHPRRHIRPVHQVADPDSEHGGRRAPQLARPAPVCPI